METLTKEKRKKQLDEALRKIEAQYKQPKQFPENHDWHSKHEWKYKENPKKKYPKPTPEELEEILRIEEELWNSWLDNWGMSEEVRQPKKCKKCGHFILFGVCEVDSCTCICDVPR